MFQIALDGTKVDPAWLALPLPGFPAIAPLGVLHAAIRRAKRDQRGEPFIINAVGSFEVNQRIVPAIDGGHHDTRSAKIDTKLHASCSHASSVLDTTDGDLTRRPNGGELIAEAALASAGAK